MLAKHISDNRLIIRIYKEITKLKKTIFKMGKMFIDIPQRAIVKYK